MVYSIGEVAKMMKVCNETLRLWEAKGFIPKPNRRPSGFREYTDGDIQAIREFLSQKNK